MANLTNSAKLIEEMEKKINASDVWKAGKTNLYNDLDWKPTIPTVNSKKIKFQKNWAQFTEITDNSSSDQTVNIQLTKADVGLWNVDNTSDASKPISNATQTALNAKADASSVYTKAEVDSAISTAVSSVYKYKGSVASYANLPSTWLTVWDVYNVEDTWDNYAWTWDIWDKLWWTVDLSNYFNKTTDTSDSITQWSSKLFVSSTEKTTWNNKQNALTAAQLAAANSWITSTKVSTYDWYATTIWNKANTADVLTKTNTTSYTPTADYHPATKVYVDGKTSAVSWISTTQPSSPSTWAMYYDSTNNIVKVYNGTSWEEVGWGNVIAMTQAEYDALDSATKNDWKLRIITDAPSIEMASKEYVDDNFLAKANTTAFTPTWDYQPATKKYVDDNAWWTDYSWVEKSWSSIELWLRTIVNTESNITLAAPSSIKDWEEYALRCVNVNSYTIALWEWFTNPFDVDLTLSANATDQFVFLAVQWTLELQPQVVISDWTVSSLVAWNSASTNATTATLITNS